MHEDHNHNFNMASEQYILHDLSSHCSIPLPNFSNYFFLINLSCLWDICLSLPRPISKPLKYCPTIVFFICQPLPYTISPWLWDATWPQLFQMQFVLGYVPDWLVLYSILKPSIVMHVIFLVMMFGKFFLPMSHTMMIHTTVPYKWWFFPYQVDRLYCVDLFS